MIIDILNNEPVLGFVVLMFRPPAHGLQCPILSHAVLVARQARILKAVYFPNGNFVDATIGASPSRVWRAIVDGKEVLQQGLIRGIGNGESTDIWSMNWLPRAGLMRPICCRLENDRP